MHWLSIMLLHVVASKLEVFSKSMWAEVMSVMARSEGVCFAVLLIQSVVERARSFRSVPRLLYMAREVMGQAPASVAALQQAAGLLPVVAAEVKEELRAPAFSC